MQDVWTLIEEAPKTCEATADLYHWSTNYDSGKTPFSLYLDLIGWSEDELGEPLFDLRNVSTTFGYVELGKLAAALDEYSDSPTIVRDFVDRLMEAETGTDEYGDISDDA